MTHLETQKELVNYLKDKPLEMSKLPSSDKIVPLYLQAFKILELLLLQLHGQLHVVKYGQRQSQQVFKDFEIVSTSTG